MLRNKTLFIVSIAVCIDYIGIGMITPVRILYAQSQGASLAIIGAMASAYLIANFLFQYPGGWIADHWGRKPMIIMSLTGQAILSLLYIFINDPILFVVLRFIEGIVAAAFLPAARALISENVDNEQRGEAFGIFEAFFNTGFILGPALGGVLGSLSYSIPFIGGVVTRLISLLLIVFWPGSENKGLLRSENKNSEDGRLQKLFTASLCGTYILGFGDYLYLGFDSALAPLWMHDHLNASIGWIGASYLFWSAPVVILSPFAGRIADRRKRSTIIFIFGLGQIPFYIASGLSNWLVTVMVIFTLQSILYTFTITAIDANLATATTSTMHTRIQSLYSTFGLLGSFVGATALSYLYTLNFRYPLFAMGITYGICVVIGGLLIRLEEQHTHAGKSNRQIPVMKK